MALDDNVTCATRSKTRWAYTWFQTAAETIYMFSIHMWKQAALARNCCMQHIRRITQTNFLVITLEYYTKLTSLNKKHWYIFLMIICMIHPCFVYVHHIYTCDAVFVWATAKTVCRTSKHNERHTHTNKMWNKTDIRHNTRLQSTTQATHTCICAHTVASSCVLCVQCYWPITSTGVVDVGSSMMVNGDEAAAINIYYIYMCVWFARILCIGHSSPHTHTQQQRACSCMCSMHIIYTENNWRIQRRFVSRKKGSTIFTTYFACSSAVHIKNHL